MHLLTDEELTRALNKLPEWKRDGDRIVRTFAFAGFREAIHFVQGAAELAEEHGHHPDMDIRFNLVHVGLTTHDRGGITDRDANMAAQLDDLGSADKQP